jgi:hypothetical protein
LLDISYFLIGEEVEKNRYLESTVVVPGVGNQSEIARRSSELTDSTFEEAAEGIPFIFVIHSPKLLSGK